MNAIRTNSLLVLSPGRKAQYLFEHLRSEGARAFGERLRREGMLERLLPAVGAEAREAAKSLDDWLAALDQWQLKEGNLTPVLCFASRVWPLALTHLLVDRAASTLAPLHKLTAAAFPALGGASAPLAQICAVIHAQASLAARDGQAWICWPPSLRQEALRLMKWRELQGEVQFGLAARCYAALRQATSGHVAQAPPARPARSSVESLGSWHLGQCALAQSRADVEAPEFPLLGASVCQVTEASETAVGCLTLLCRLLGQDVDALTLSAEVPISNDGISLKDWQRLCRRVGLQAETRHQQPTSLDKRPEPAFLRLVDGSCLLLLDTGESWCRAYVPGLDFPFRWLRTDALVAEPLAFWCVMTGSCSSGAPRARPERTPKPKVLTPGRYALGFANAEALSQLHAEAARWPFTSSLAPTLAELSVAGTAEAHRSLGADGSPLHGEYRRVNLHCGSPMVVWQQVPQAMDELFRHIDAMPPELDAPHVIERVAAVFIDFLTIHPFINGNRRTGMALAAALFARHGFRLDLSGISRIEIYYAVRCAVAGHLRPLINIFARRLTRPPEPTASRLPA